MGEGRENVIVLLVRHHEMLRTMAKAPRTKDELSAALGLSRSTIDRHIRKLEMNQLVEPTQGGYTMSAAGQLAIETYEELDIRLANFDRLARALAVLPPDAPLDSSLLSGEVTLSGPNVPHQPVTEYATAIEQATHVRAVIPTITPQIIELYHRKITKEGTTAQFLLTEAVLERLITTYTTEFRGMLDTGRLSIRRVEEVDYGVAIVETELGISVNLLLYLSGGVHALVKSIDPASVQWADIVFAQRWRTAELLPNAG
jgi:predicted transcriptional regulator